MNKILRSPDRYRARIIKLSVPVDDCWVWIGTVGASAAGKCYGRLSVRMPGKATPVGLWAHRVSYVAFHERALAPTETVDHTCGRTYCVNPAHLTVCSRAENTRRMNARRANGT